MIFRENGAVQRALAKGSIWIIIIIIMNANPNKIELVGIEEDDIWMEMHTG